MIPKLITMLIVLLMIVLSSSPLNFAMFYILFRPLVQPYAMAHHMLFPCVPLTGIFGLVLITYSSLNCIFRRDYSILPPNIIFLYGLIFFSAISFLNTMNYMVSMSHVLKIATGVALYLLVYNSVQTESDAKKILYALVLTAIIPMLFGYYQFFTSAGGRGLMGAAIRVNSFLCMANAYGEFLCICLCATLMLLFQEKERYKRMFLLCTMCSIIVSSILALNRGSWIAMTAGLLLAYPGYRTKLKARWFVLAGMLICILFSGIIVQRFLELEETTSWGASRNTFKGRVQFWKAIITLIPIHPLTGFGIGTAKLVTDKFYKLNCVPHNDYLRLVLEIGLPGAFLYVTFLSRELFASVRLIFDKENWFINYPMLACLIYWIILSTTQNLVYNVTIFPMFMMLLAVARRWNMVIHRG